MKDILHQQRENCFKALGNLPKNLQHAYYERIMGAEAPKQERDFGQIIMYGAAASGGALVATIIFAFA